MYITLNIWDWQLSGNAIIGGFVTTGGQIENLAVFFPNHSYCRIGIDITGQNNITCFLNQYIFSVIKIRGDWNTSNSDLFIIYFLVSINNYFNAKLFKRQALDKSWMKQY